MDINLLIVKDFPDPVLFDLEGTSRKSTLEAETPARPAPLLRQLAPSIAGCAALGTHHMTVSRVWARHGLQPRRLRRFMLSEKKAADISALYLNPPDHATVFCVALDRLDPVLPLSPGRAETHRFEDYRDAPFSLAALDTRSGAILGKTAQCTAEFVDFLPSYGPSLISRPLNDRRAG